MVEFDTTSYYESLSERITEDFAEEPGYPGILLTRIEADTTGEMQEDFEELARLKHRADSLNEALNKIRERRRYIFQRPESRTRTQLLSESYDQLISTREKKDLAEIEYQQKKTKMDSLVRVRVMEKADGLLAAKKIEGYVFIEPEIFKNGVVEFHSSQPKNFLNIEILEQALQEILVEERMRETGITVTKIQELLDPITIQEFILEGSRKHKFKFMVTYLVPIIVVLFLFIGIFTSSGFLFSSIVTEKTNRVLEMLLTSARSLPLIAGKIVGLGLLGLLQISIWLLLAVILILINVIPVEEVGFLTLKNAGLFVLYFLLGYLFFASIFLGMGSLSSTDQNSNHLHQFMRILSVLPIALAILVLQSPNSMLVRILSFIPFLSPTFMILRTPLGQPPVIDYYISSAIMLISIILTVFFSSKIFSISSLIYDRRPTIKGILAMLRLK